MQTFLDGYKNRLLHLPTILVGLFLPITIEPKNRLAKHRTSSMNADNLRSEFLLFSTLPCNKQAETFFHKHSFFMKAFYLKTFACCFLSVAEIFFKSDRLHCFVQERGGNKVQSLLPCKLQQQFARQAVVRLQTHGCTAHARPSGTPPTSRR